MSTLGSTLPGGGVYDLPYALSGVSEYFVLQRVDRVVVRRRAAAVGPPEDPHHVGGGLDLFDALRAACPAAGAGDRVFCALVPVVRVPGIANTFVHPSSIGIM